MIVGVDLDGVIADFDGGWRRAYAVWYGKEVRDLTEEWDDNARLTFGSQAEFFAWVGDVPGFWQDLAPVPGALGALRELRKQGHQIRFITARPEWARSQTLRWLIANGQPSDELHFTGEKWRVPAHIYIDDSPAVLADLKEAKAPYVIRFARPWNKKAPGMSCANWDEVLTRVGIITEVEAGTAEVAA